MRSMLLLEEMLEMFIYIKIFKMQHLEGSGMPVLYIGRTVLKG
jgi:hypothetical protein